MPINYAQVQSSLQNFTQKVRRHQDDLKQAQDSLWQKLADRSNEVNSIRQRVEEASRLAINTFCAKPVSEPLLFHKGLPGLPGRYTLIAADGSQIAPNRHKAIEYCVINVGLISAEMGSAKEPDFEIQSDLLDYDRLITPQGFLIGEQEVSLLRDLAERRALLSFAAQRQGPVIAMTDGLLDIYQRLEGPQQNLNLQQELLAMHRCMQSQQMINLGYIDKPGSELLSRLFDILERSDEQLSAYSDKDRTLRGVSDAHLLTRLLQTPGERSAVFEVVNQSRGKTRPALQVHFFYLNVGEPESPYLARVEFPAWVSANPQQVDLLHAAVYRDTQVFEGHPYPYLLLRAHELAIINFAEHEEVEAMLHQKFAEEGMPLTQVSHKQFGKNNLNRSGHAG
ncbi:MAG: DNA double-strand break repair nuclease NurA [Anaerolineaceae bacterium]|nr:DNA double-strand break repair nuclease NurA [Anaerolineaceae bacterium]